MPEGTSPTRRATAARLSRRRPCSATSVIAASAIVSLGFLVLAIAVSWRAYRRRVAIGDPALIGAAGKVTVWSGTAGEVHAMGERWHAVSSTSLVPGQRVRIVERRDLTLVVEPETATAPQR
jgi:membrane-bound serine protease (ClpP class)